MPLQSAGSVLFWDNLKSEKGSTFAVLPYIQITCEVTEHRRTGLLSKTRQYPPGRAERFHVRRPPDCHHRQADKLPVSEQCRLRQL